MFYYHNPALASSEPSAPTPGVPLYFHRAGVIRPGQPRRYDEADRKAARPTARSPPVGVYAHPAALSSSRSLVQSATSRAQSASTQPGRPSRSRSQKTRQTQRERRRNPSARGHGVTTGQADDYFEFLMKATNNAAVVVPDALTASLTAASPDLIHAASTAHLAHDISASGSSVGATSSSCCSRTCPCRHCHAHCVLGRSPHGHSASADGDCTCGTAQTNTSLASDSGSMDSSDSHACQCGCAHCAASRARVSASSEPRTREKRAAPPKRAPSTPAVAATSRRVVDETYDVYRQARLAAEIAAATRTNAAAGHASSTAPKKKPLSPTERLRQVFTELCTCYWHDFIVDKNAPEAPISGGGRGSRLRRGERAVQADFGIDMPINPASHAATCPCFQKQELYEEVMCADDERTAVDSEGQAEGDGEKTDKGATTTAASRGRRVVSAEAELAAERTRGAASGGDVVRGHARAAVFGTSKRRSCFDIQKEEEEEESGADRHAAARRTRASPPKTHRTEAAATEAEQTEEACASARDGHGDRDEKTEPVEDGAPSPVVRDKEKGTSPPSRARASSQPTRRRRGVPGPGAYDVDAAFTQSSRYHAAPGGRIGKAARMPSPKHASPGPGAYSPPLMTVAEERKAFRERLKAQRERKAAASAAAAAGEASSQNDAAIKTEVGFLSSRPRPSAVTGDAISVYVDPKPRPVVARSPARDAADAAEQTDESAAPAKAKSPHAVAWYWPYNGPGPAAYYPENTVDHNARYVSPPAYSFARASARLPGPERPFTAADVSSDASPAKEEGEQPTSAKPTRTTSPVPGPGAYPVYTGEEVGATNPRYGRGGVIAKAPNAPDGGRSPLFTAPMALVPVARPSTSADEMEGVEATRAPHPDARVDTDGAKAGGPSSVTQGDAVDAGKKGKKSPVVAPYEKKPLPGPGDYELPALLPGGRAVIFHPPPPLRAGRKAKKHARRDGADDNQDTPARTDEDDEDWCRDEEDVPGPGHYDTSTALKVMSHVQSSPGWTFPTSSRRPPWGNKDEKAGEGGERGQEAVVSEGDAAVDVTPVYTLVDPRSKTYRFGTAPRGVREGQSRPASRRDGVDSDADDAPGPGTYDIAPDVSRTGVTTTTGRSFSSGVRRYYLDDLLRDAAAHPGPGAYAVSHAVVEPHTTSAVIPQAAVTVVEMDTSDDDGDDTSARRSAGTSGAPGPGHYAAAEAQAVLWRREPSAVMGTAARSKNSAFGDDDDDDDDGTLRGPGTYDLPSLPRGPQFTIAGRPATRFPAEGEQLDGVVPGPGSYEPTEALTQRRVRGVRLDSTSPRFTGPYADAVHAVDGEDANASATAVPGPGSYDPVHPIPAARAVLFGQAPRFPDAAAPNAYAETEARGAGYANVGPGTYDPKWSAVESGQAGGTSFAHAPRFPEPAFVEGDGETHKAESVPGPGRYDPQPVERRGRHAVFGTSPGHDGTGGERDGDVDDVPGPGAYAPQHALVEPRIPGPMFGQPGEEVAHRLEDTSAGLGPGAYDPQTPAAHAYPSTTFAKAPRQTPTAASGSATGPALGPGAYSPVYPSDRPLGGAVVFGTASRESGTELTPQRYTPGPGTYDVLVTRDGRCFLRSDGRGALPFAPSTHTHQSDSHASESTPGPGSYTLLSEFDLTALRTAPGGTTFSRAPRAGVESNAATSQDTPGPGAYEITRAPVPVPGAGRFGSAPRRSEAEELARTQGEMPGPGAYVLTVSSSGGVSFTRGPRFGPEEGDARDAVGPGTYSPSYDAVLGPRAPAALLGTTAPARDGAEATRSPGPGTYEPAPLPHGAAASFTRTARPCAVAAHETSDPAPGPGAYSTERAESLVRPMAPAYRFGTSTDGAIPSAVTPGPGTYDVPQLFPEGPSFGFGTVPPAPLGAHGLGETPRDTDDVPGPGTYTLPDWTGFNSGVAFRMSRGQARPIDAADRDRAQFPGPGHYDEMVAPAAGHVFGTAPRLDAHGVTAESAGPGPGAYAVPSTLTGPAMSFPRSERGLDGVDSGVARAADEAAPGPGTYDVVLDAARRQAPAVSIGQASRFQGTSADGGGDSDETPGVGYYDIPVSLRRSGAAAFFGTAPREEAHLLRDRAIPGPGAYDVAAASAAVLPRPPAAFMLGRTGPLAGASGAADAATLREDGPGPGAYDVAAASAATARRAPVPLLTGKPRDADLALAQAAETPGPGTYALPPAHAGRAATVTGRLADIEARWREAQEMPGPGTYALPDPPRGPSASLAGRTLDSTARAREDVPGPGTYALPALPRGPAAAFLGTRADAGEVDRAPGPGTYDVDRFAEQYERGPAYTFGSRHRESGREADEAGVGPGLYDVAERDQGRSVAIGTAPRFTDVDAEVYGITRTPGPGTYHRPERWGEVGAGGLAYSFGTATPHTLTAEDNGVPGPGTYHRLDDLTREGVAGISFGHAARDEGMSRDHSAFPGPGAYYRVDYDERGISFPRAERELHAPSDVPGPGTYYKDEMDSRGISFPRAERELHAPSDVPGPGTYYKDEMDSRGISFPRAERELHAPSDVPGPGTYYKDEMDSRGISFPRAERELHAPSDVPGPGTYYKDEMDSRGISFPRAERELHAPSNVPGPGTYYKPESTSKGISFTRAERDATPVHNRPGPGEYYKEQPAAQGVAPQTTTTVYVPGASPLHRTSQVIKTLEQTSALLPPSAVASTTAAASTTTREGPASPAAVLARLAQAGYPITPTLQKVEEI